MPSSAIHSEKDRIALFNALVLRHKSMIWHICSDYGLGKAWNIEDCIQEVMVNLWRDFDKFEGRSSEKTWVWRVATNTMLMLKRKDVRSPQTDSIDTEDVEKKDNEPSNENYQQLQQLIETLPEESGTVIRAFLDGFSYKEIADNNNRTIWLFFYNSQEECNNILTHIKDDIVLKDRLLTPALSQRRGS